MSKSTLLLFILWLCLWQTNALAQRQPSRFFSSDRELSNSLVNHIAQDRKGYIWITSEDGLNRYDGISFTTFRHKSGDSQSLRHNYVTQVFEDSRGNIWVATIKGIQLFDRSTDLFSDVRIIKNSEQLSPHVTSILETSSGDILISTSGRGIFVYNRAKNIFDPHLELNSKTVNDFISRLFEDRDKNIWIASENNGLFCYNITTGTVGRYFSPDQHSHCDISSIAQDNDGIIYIGIISGGLHRFDGNNFTALFPDGPFAQLSIKSLMIRNDNRLLVGTDGDGLKILDPSLQQLEPMDLITSELDFRKAKVHALKQDRDGNLWIGVFQKGVFMLPNTSSNFKYYGYQPNSLYSIGSGCVMSLMSDNESRLWVGTDNDGLYLLDTDGRVMKHYSQESGSVPKAIMTLHQDPKGNIWIGSYFKGLAVLNRNKEGCIYLNDLLHSKYEGYSNKVRCITADGNDNIWIGTYGSGLFRIDSHTNEVKHWISTSESKSGTPTEIINNWINCIFNDANGLIWIGTYRGVSCFDPGTGRFIPNETLDTYLFGRVVFNIYQDKNGIYWFGTTEGLVRYDAKSSEAELLTTDNGLCGNSICAIEGDDDGNIWISTYSGLSKYNDKTRKSTNYYSYNGLQGNEFYAGSVCKAADGQIYFGGIQGITGFYPDAIQPVERKLNIDLINFYIYGVKVNKGDLSSGHEIMNKAVIEADTFVISYHDNAFAFEFSTFDFVGSERVVYDYHLEGFNKSWHGTPATINRVDYTNLSPGTYRLTAQAHIDEVYSPAKIITLIVMPAWYQTWWAVTIYILIVFLIGVLLFNYIVSKIRFRHELIRREHEEMIKEAKLQFFYNISHEIRTPLSLVINPLEKLISDKETQNKHREYLIIYKNAQRILRLINQMFDVRKIDQGKMEMRFTETPIVQFVTDIMGNFFELAKQKNIEFTIDQNVDNLKVWIDTNNFDKVIFNVLSNAFKFTPDGGSIKIDMAVDNSGNMLLITVTDSGIGIDASESENIFERFYQANNDQTRMGIGTGIGLHLSRSIVGLHGGKIYAQPSTGVGARFIIELPIGNSHIDPSHIVTNPEETITGPSPVMSPISEVWSPITTPKSKSNIKVLVVDDEPDIREYLKEELGIHYKVIDCSNGKEAYEAILKEKPHIVVSDVMMPEIDGITLCRKLKSNVNINHIPVILLTARYTEEDKGVGLNCGADAYIEKPFSIEILKLTINNLIENRELLKVKFFGNSEMENQIKPINIKSSDEILLRKVVDLINERISDPDLNVEVLAAHVGMSRVHMHRKLKELTNQSARDFIRSIRLKQAAILLTKKKLGVAEAAYAVGYSNPSHFSNSFKDFFGMSPKEYTDNHEGNE